MTEVDRVVGQLDRAFSGDAWHGPSVMRLLDGVTAAEAIARPIAGAHTIWELVRHIAAWKQEVTRRLDGLVARNLPAEEDFPPDADHDEASWRAALDALAASHRSLRERVALVADERLGDDAGGDGSSSWTIYETVHGVVQHDLYHAGQIALLRKA